jgi:probable F420-dependent oxidoreductase
VEFGFTLPNNWGVDDVAGVVALAPLAEQAGYSSVWVNHHLLNVGYVGQRLGDRPYYDALTMLTWAAASTERVGLGTSVLVVPYLSPFVVAKAMATLDRLSGGRVRCGVGVGSLEEEHRAVSRVDYDERGRYADEFLAVLVELWTADRPSFAGDFFTFDDVVASPKPLQRPHPPIVVGGNRPPALRRVARFGQAWHALAPSPEGVRQRLVVLDEALAAVGRSRPDVGITVRADLQLLDRPTDPGKRPQPLRGTAAELIDRVEAYAAAGVDELVVSVPSADLDEQRRQLVRFAEEVMPRVR